MSEEAKNEIEKYRTLAMEIQVGTPDEMTAAEAILVELRRRKKVWLDAVEATVKGAHAAWKAAVAHRDSVAKPIDEAEAIVKKRIAEYVYKQRRIAEAERARLQADADAKAEAERRRALAAAEKLKTPELREERIQQAVLNLLHNAVKFNHPGGRIKVSNRIEGKYFVVSVSDTGAGIPRAAIGHIFERFYKTDTSRSGQGSGMGLAIAKHIIEAHGGSISAASEEGKGSTFTFRLPTATR